MVGAQISQGHGTTTLYSVPQPARQKQSNAQRLHRRQESDRSYGRTEQHSTLYPLHAARGSISCGADGRTAVGAKR